MQLEARSLMLDGTVEVHLRGELGAGTTHSLDALLGEVIVTTAPPRIVVDLSELTFCDITALGLFAAHARRCGAAGGSLRLANARSQVARLIEVTGLSDLTTKALG